MDYHFIKQISIDNNLMCMILCVSIIFSLALVLIKLTPKYFEHKRQMLTLKKQIEKEKDDLTQKIEAYKQKLYKVTDESEKKNKQEDVLKFLIGITTDEVKLNELQNELKNLYK